MTMPEGQREALVLVALAMLSYRDAAEVLGIPIGKLSSRLDRGKYAAIRGAQGRLRPRDGQRGPARTLVDASGIVTYFIVAHAIFHGALL